MYWLIINFQTDTEPNSDSSPEESTLVPRHLPQPHQQQHIAARDAQKWDEPLEQKALSLIPPSSIVVPLEERW